MLGNKDLLDVTHLSKTNPHTPAMDTAKKLGLENPDKPYYAILNPSNGKGVEITPDMVNIGQLSKNPEALKKAIKSVDTPRLYGAKKGQAVINTTDAILTHAGFGKATKESPNLVPASASDKAKAKILASHLVNNFDKTPIAEFESKFKALAEQAPDNFVFTNPVSGFKMSFQKHNLENYQVAVKDSKGEPFRISIRSPGSANLSQSTNSMMPLFVQSMDAAVKDYVTVKLKNPYTKHDAFAVPKIKGKKEGQKTAVETLKKTVAEAYTAINKANPIGSLAKQMMQQHRALVGKQVRDRSIKSNKRPKYKMYTMDDYNKSVKAINNALNNFFPSGKPPAINIPPDSGHLELE